VARTRVDGCRAVVTGAGSGLGQAFARAIVARGGRVVAADVNPAGAEETVAELRVRGGQAAAHPFTCDVGIAEAVGALARFAEATLGGVDLLVNNAGVAVAGNAATIPLEDWRFAIGVNLWGVIHGTAAFVPLLRRQGRGHILNVASLAGLVSAPGLAPYNVSKAGVVALSETLYAELRSERIGVTVLCPSFFQTGILDSSRGGDPASRDLVRRLMARSRLQADDVARHALRAVERGRLYALPMWDSRGLWLLKRVAPRFFSGVAARLAPRVARP